VFAFPVFSVSPWFLLLRPQCAAKGGFHLPNATTRAILAAMHRSVISARLFLALLLLILIHPASHVHAAGTPNSAETPTISTTKPPSTNPATGYYYTVQPADTLWDIAMAHGITVETLTAANDLPDPRHLAAGQKIFVPALPAVVPRKPAPTAPAAPSTPVPEATIAPAQEATQTPPAEALPPESAPVDTPAAPPPEPPPAEPPAPEASAVPEPDGSQAEMLGLINTKRDAQGLPALVWSPELASAAQAHAEDCAQRNRGSHTGSDGARLAERLARIGYAAGSASENWANAQNIQHAFGMWWNEPKGRDPHRRNILNPRFTEIGIGVARGAWGYYIVADFGRR
jgi:uncharacterized protein YkwD